MKYILTDGKICYVNKIEIIKYIAQIICKITL